MPLHLSLPQAAPGETRRFELAPEQVPAWLGTLPKEDPVKSGRLMLDQLVPLNRIRVRITLRQDVTEGILGYAEHLLPRLDAALASGTLPLSIQGRNAAGIAEELLTELAYSYKLLLVEQSRRLFGFASSGRALLPVIRAIQMLAQRLKLGYRMYATNPKAVWHELHELYQFALRRGLANRSLVDGGETPMSVYRGVLLLSFAEPLKLMQGDLDRVAAWLDRFGNQATLGPAGQQKSGQGLFLIKAQRDVPGYALSKRHHPVPQSHDLLLNTLPLAEHLLDQLARLSAGETAASLSLPAEADDPAFRDLMGRLVKHWGAVPNRRFTRLRTHARVEVCVGIGGIWEFLNSRGAAKAGNGEWMVTNESPRGFALMHVKGPIEPIRVGEVVGLRTRESHTCHICVVRWVLSDNPEHLELGLEELAPTARPVSIRKTRGAPQEAERVLLLPEVPSLNQAPAILAPLFPLDSTCELSLGDLQSKLRVRATRLLERTVSVQLVQFSAVS
jgi:cyclic-di-GMP-binding protein